MSMDAESKVKEAYNLVMEDSVSPLDKAEIVLADTQVFGTRKRKPLA